MMGAMPLDDRFQSGEAEIAMKKQATSPHSRAGCYRVFLSHATYDKWIAAVIHEKIEAADPLLKVWRDDRDINGGDCIPDTIRVSLHECDELLVLVTPESQGREWVKLEVGAAWGIGKRIVPIFYHVNPGDAFDILRDRRGYALNDLSAYIQDLAQRAKAKVSDG